MTSPTEYLAAQKSAFIARVTESAEWRDMYRAGDDATRRSMLETLEVRGAGYVRYLDR